MGHVAGGHAGPAAEGAWPPFAWHVPRSGRRRVRVRRAPSGGGSVLFGLVLVRRAPPEVRLVRSDMAQGSEEGRAAPSAAAVR